jgi:hypothetical protein
MSPEEKDRSRYYQEIAAAFFKQRGGPFMLSPRDLTTIASWETLGVPLQAAREGIERAFEYFKTQARDPRKVRALAACNSQVLKAFERLRDRRVGRQVPVRSRLQKKAAIMSEVGGFLKDLPRPVSFLKEPYEHALGLLKQDQPDEQALERLEEQVERLLADQCPAVDRAAVRKDVEAEFPSLGAKEASEILSLKLLKTMRSKYGIPYLTFPYY